MKRLKSTAQFSLYGKNLDPSYVTKILEIQPTDSWSAGHSINEVPRNCEGGWIIKNNFVDEIDICKCADSLMALLMPKESLIRNFVLGLGYTAELLFYVQVIKNVK